MSDPLLLFRDVKMHFPVKRSFLEALVGAEIGTGEEARRRASRLVAVFDPCVSFDVSVQEATHA